MKHIYLIGGLGTDARVFQKMDFSGCEATFLEWLPPVAHEPIQQYAQRMAVQIPTPKPILVGLSFGGIMAIEMAKVVDTEMVVLIASVKNRQEIPFYFRWPCRLGLHKLLPMGLVKTPNFITDWLFTVSAAGDRVMLAAIIRDTDPAFLKWAIDKVASWDNTAPVRNLWHIHGTGDRVFPVRFLRDVIKVAGGGHFMTYNKSDEVAQKLGALFAQT